MSFKSGAEAFIKAAYEDPDVWTEDANSMTAPDSTEFSFGHGVDYSINRSNNKVRVFGTGSRNATTTAILQYTVGLGVNGTLSNAYWLLGVLGLGADGGSGPTYTHTYTEADVLPTFAAWAVDKFDTTITHLIQGCATNQLTLSMAVNESVKFTLDCLGRHDKTVSTESQVSETEEVFTFAGGVIETPTGTTIAAVQNMELTVNNTIELVYGTGSRFATGYVAKNREYGFRMTVAVENNALLSRLYDGTDSSTEPSETTDGEIATLKLTFTNLDGYSIVFSFTGVHFNDDTSNRAANELIKQDITGWCHALTDAVYTNGTIASPAQATNV